MKLFKNVLFIACIFVNIVVHADNTPRHFPPGVHDVMIPDVTGVRNNLLRNIAPVVEKSISKGLYPGAVILASHRGQIIYRGVFGNRRIVPDAAPMTFDTIFDVASLTKAVVTSTAIMQLVEQGKLDLDLPVGCYWPAFTANGKEAVTVRELLTHTSGFPSDVTFPKSDATTSNTNQNPTMIYGEAGAFKGIEQQALVNPPGKVFKYSDVNFVSLGHLVEIISGEHLDIYARNHIFKPLNMQRTFYNPPLELRNDIAPTQIINGKLRWGEVHDDTVYLMGGVAGMAGLFSTAKDLGTFAECLLDGGRIRNENESEKKYLLGPLTILKMTSPQTPSEITDVYGLGWDIDSVYSNRGILFPHNSYGHTGFTGTSIWIDPATHTWLIILTSRTHPIPASVNQLIQDRKAIANIVAGSITDVQIGNISNTGLGELARAYKDKSK